MLSFHLIDVSLIHHGHASCHHEYYYNAVENATYQNCHKRNPDGTINKWKKNSIEPQTLTDDEIHDLNTKRQQLIAVQNDTRARSILTMFNSQNVLFIPSDIIGIIHPYLLALYEMYVDPIPIKNIAETMSNYVIFDDDTYYTRTGHLERGNYSWGNVRGLRVGGHRIPNCKLYHTPDGCFWEGVGFLKVVCDKRTLDPSWLDSILTAAYENFQGR